MESGLQPLEAMYLSKLIDKDKRFLYFVSNLKTQYCYANGIAL